ncbi:hypothetical protein KKA14_21215 [bacterium]|nr:hypothetical protein [bacterium]
MNRKGIITNWSIGLFPVVLCLMFFLSFSGCKDTGLTDSVSMLEECKIKLDEREWDDAITACEAAGGDEGYHRAAQAYMGKAGLTLLNLIETLSNTSSSSNSASAIFSYVPDSESDKQSYRAALSHLMGPNITNKTDVVYLEGLLLSSMLVLNELKDLFKLEIAAGSATVCDIDATSDPDKCGFTFDVTTDAPFDRLSFSGFGSSFYNNLCGDATTDHDGANRTVVTTLTYDVTIDACIIQSTSVLRYNRDAFIGLGNPLAFQDSTGDSIFKTLDFFSKFNSNKNFTKDVSGDAFNLCYTPEIKDASGDDTRINDCEILGTLLDPSTDLF